MAERYSYDLTLTIQPIGNICQSIVLQFYGGLYERLGPSAVRSEDGRDQDQEA